MEHNLREAGFFGTMEPEQMTAKYGSPVYVYNEGILRSRCRELKQMVTYPHFVIDYSIKANFNPALLQIVKKKALRWMSCHREKYIWQKWQVMSRTRFFISVIMCLRRRCAMP